MAFKAICMPGNFKGGGVGCDEHVQGQTGSGDSRKSGSGVEATLSGDLKTLQMDPRSFSLSPSVCFISSLVSSKSHI